MDVTNFEGMAQAKPYHRRNLIFLAVGSLFTALVISLPLFFPSLRAWGVNYVSFLPFWSQIITIAALVLILTSIFSFRARGMYEAITCYLDGIGESKKSRIAVLSVLLLGSVFILFHVNTYFLGDGYQWMANFGSPDSPYLRSIKFTVLGSSYLVRGIQLLLGGISSHSALLAFQILSYLSGIIVVRNVMSISKQFYPDFSRRLYFTCAIIFTPVLLLFFGYVEFYPALWAGLSFFLLYSIRAINGKSTFLLTICFFLLASLLHLSAVFYGLGLVAILISEEKYLTFIRNHRMFLISAISVISVAAIIAFVSSYSGNIAFRNIFLPPFHGKPIAPEYGIFTALHFADIFNLALLCSPVAALWFSSGGGVKGMWSNSCNRFLLFCGAGGVLFLMIIDPKLGFARDWDLMSFTLFPVNMLLVKRTLDHAGGHWRRTAIPLILISTLMTTAFVFVNVKEDTSLKRYEHLLDLDTQKSRTGWYIWSKFQRAKGEFEIARYANYKIDSLFPEERIAHRAYKYMEQGIRFDQVQIATQICLLADSFSVEANLLAARYYHTVGKTDSAAAFFKRTFQLEPTAPMAFIFKAEFLSDKGDLIEAVNLLNNGLHLHPRNKRMDTMLREYQIRLDQFDGADQFRETLLKSNER